MCRSHSILAGSFTSFFFQSVDVATAVEYNEGKLFYNPNERVFNALLVFTIFGLIISLMMRIPLYCWNICLIYSGDESNDKCCDLLDLGAQSFKVIKKRPSGAYPGEGSRGSGAPLLGYENEYCLKRKNVWEPPFRNSARRDFRL